MSSYAWSPRFKFVPTDGIEETLDLMAVLPPTSVDPSHESDVSARRDVNRKGNARVWGFLPTCKMKFEVIDTTRVAYLLLIANRLRASALWTTYLSLDGGVTYRQVEAAAKVLDGPDAIQGKTFAGARYTLSVVGVDLIDTVPDLGTGVW